MMLSEDVMTKNRQVHAREYAYAQAKRRNLNYSVLMQDSPADAAHDRG